MDINVKENKRKGFRIRKELGVDNFGVQKTMRWYHFLGDGTTMLALNALSGLVGMLTYFYTDKIGLSAGIVGTILLATKFCDAFTDLFMGRIVDKTKSKWGKARPWFLWMSLPIGLIIIALFCIPANASNTVKNIYAFITNILATAVIYTAIAIPYGCIMATRTKSIAERGTMGIVRSIFGYIAGMVISILLIPITNMLGGDQAAWIKVAIVFGIISFISLIITFATSKEQVVDVKENAEVLEDDISFKESIVLLFKNKYWVMMLVIMLILNITYSLNGSTGVYYTKYILGNENLVGIMGAVGLIPVFVGFALVGPMIRFFGLSKTAKIAFLIGIAASIVRVFTPYSFMSALIGGAFITFSTIPMMAVGGVLVNNTIEYGEWKYGKRIVGMTNSASGFGSKIGSGLGAAMIGWFLALGGYDGTLAVQSQTATNMILFICVYLPAILLVVMYLILRKYDLDEKYPQIVKELEERKAQK